MQKLPTSLPFLTLLTALLASACTTDAEDPASTIPPEATSAPTEAAAPSTPLPTETAQATPSPTATQERNFVGDFGDYPFVVLVAQDTADLLEDTPPDPVLTFEDVATPSEALERVEDIDAAGLILDAATYADFPIENLAALYDEGRVIVAFEVALDELMFSMSSGERESAMADPGHEIRSPFYALAHATRPDVRPRTGQAQASVHIPEFFESQLARAADIAAGRIRP